MTENKLSAGFARVNITPPMNMNIAGYFVERLASGVLDELEIQALAVSDGQRTAVILSADLLGLSNADLMPVRESISKTLGIPVEAVFIACTHTHTGPIVSTSLVGEVPEKFEFYLQTLRSKFIDAAFLAVQDLKPARMGYAVATAPNIAFIRRFRMKDGRVRTNPGVNNPDIVRPIGEVDERVNVLRFARQEGDILLVNFGDHPDTVGGDLVSADYPRFVRETLENAIPGCRAVFLNGAQGDVNHVNVKAQGGDKNGLVPMFDGCDRGYEHTKHIGRTIAGAVLGVYGKVSFTDIDSIDFKNSVCSVPANKAEAEQLPLARKYAELHEAGKDDEIPFEGMELTTVVAEALRMLRLENGPDSFELPMSAIAIGPAVIVGIPGEPFTNIGRGIKDGSPFEITLPCCCANGYEGYFPMQEAYDEGGYEARSSSFKAGVAERIIESGNALTASLK